MISSDRHLEIDYYESFSSFKIMSDAISPQFTIGASGVLTNRCGVGYVLPENGLSCLHPRWFDKHVLELDHPLQASATYPGKLSAL